jgi:two-component system chemotaxis response regulator CheY
MTSPSIDILLAEDDQPLRDAMTELLNDAGYSVEAVSNGRDALDWLQDSPTPPKLILLDLMMPIMDGWQFLEAQQKAANTAAIPVVVLSASGIFNGTHETLMFMRKPVAVTPLLELIARYCGEAADSR